MREGNFDIFIEWNKKGANYLLYKVNSNKIISIIKFFIGLLIRRPLVRIQPGVPVEQGVKSI